jgi:hypothetical protein
MHKIGKEDRVYLAVIPELFDGLGWHKLGTPTKEFSAETLQHVLFEHDFAEAGILLPDGTFHKTGERYAIAKDTGLPIGTTVSDRYARPTNKQLFELLQRSLTGSGFEIVSCGTVEDRVQFFVDAKQKDLTRAAGRDIANFFGIHAGFGGKSSTVFCGHNTVIQCGNTTALFLQEALKNEGVIKAKNTTNILEKLPGIEKAIEFQIGVAGEFAKAMEASAKVKMTREQARDGYLGSLATVLTVPLKEVNTRAANRVKRMTDLFQIGAGNGGENAADFFNGFTDYFTHESATSENDDLSEKKNEQRRAKQWFSSEFGTARTVKQNLSEMLFEKGKFRREGLNKLIETGRELYQGIKDKDLIAAIN